MGDSSESGAFEVDDDSPSSAGRSPSTGGCSTSTWDRCREETFWTAPGTGVVHGRRRRTGRLRDRRGPEYGPTATDLEPLCRRSVADNVEQLYEKRDLFVWDYYGDVETRGRYQRAAAERFLADYATHPERYVASRAAGPALRRRRLRPDAVGQPALPVRRPAGGGFHHEAMAELSRVTDGEVRVFTLASLDRERSEFVEPVVERLRADGHGVEFREVPYEFQPGATEMLVVEAG